MRLGITSAVISALIGFFCAAVPLSAAQAQDDQYKAAPGQLDSTQAQPFLDKYREPKTPDANAAAAGMAAAPAMIQAAGLKCTPTEARLIGSVDTSGKSGKVTYKAVETTCKGSLGYILLQGNNNKPTFADCLAAKAQSGAKPTALTCTLPANNNATTVMQSWLQRAHSDCAPTNAAYQGGTATIVGYEVSCQAGTGMLVQVDTPLSDTSAVHTASCYGYASSRPADAPWPCKLTNKETELGIIKALAEKSTPPCTATKDHWVGAQTDGTEFVEFACSDGKGIVVVASDQGKVVRTIPCAQAGTMCTLTKVDMASAAGELTPRVKAAGGNCDVDKFQTMKLANGITEALEVTCKSGPGGLLLTKDGKTMYFDCGRSEAEGYACGMNGKDAANLAMTAQLKAQGKTSCVVNGTRAMASATSAYVEVSCSDGAPGYMLKFPRTSNTPAESYDVYTCADAKKIGGGCALPTNKLG